MGEIDKQAEPNSRGNPLGLGLVLCGAAMLLVSVFLPMNEPTDAFHLVQQNTLIQHGGWMLAALAIGIAGAGVRGYLDRSQWGWSLAGGIAAGLGIAYWWQDKSLRTLYPIGADGRPDTTETGVTADWGISIYVAGVGALLAIAGARILRQQSAGVEAASSTKRCPDCAEPVLRDALVCKHCGLRFDPPKKQVVVGIDPEYATGTQLRAMRRVKCFKCRTSQLLPRDVEIAECVDCAARMKIPAASS